DVTDGTGSSIDHIDYLAFGGILSETNSAQTGRFGFQGLPFNRTAQETHAFYRDLLFITGMWKETDPEEFDADDANLYRTMGNDPINAMDPSGLQQDRPIQVGPIGSYSGTGSGGQAGTFRPFPAANSSGGIPGQERMTFPPPAPPVK